MKIIVDSTNPENDDGLLYLSVVDVPEEFVCDRETNPFGYEHIIFEHDGDIYDEFTTHASFVVDISQNLAELVARADDKAKEHYYLSDSGELDEQIVAINQVLLDLINVTGSNGVYWAHF